VKPVLRPQHRADERGRPWHDSHAVLHGVLWVLGTGAQWRELPEEYPSFQSCHRRFAMGAERVEWFTVLTTAFCCNA
jgi:transposase